MLKNRRGRLLCRPLRRSREGLPEHSAVVFEVPRQQHIRVLGFVQGRNSALLRVAL